MRQLNFVLFLCVVTGCKTAPALDDVLPAMAAGEVAMFSVQARLDQEAQVARAWAERNPGEAVAQATAARALAVAADLRLIEDQVKRADGAGLTVSDLVQLDDESSSELKNAVLGLCTAGLAFGELAVALDPFLPEARQYRAFNLSLVAWAEGKTTAILRGRGPKLKAALEANATDLGAFHAAAPLRLRGRFLDRAPWPYGDREKAIELLREAVEIAPVPVNWQFLGDALWVDGNQEGALAAWGAGAVAPAAPSTEYGATLRRRLNQLRCDSFDVGQSVSIP